MQAEGLWEEDEPEEEGLTAAKVAATLKDRPRLQVGSPSTHSVVPGPTICWVKCHPFRAVTLPNIGVSLYIGVEYTM